MAKGVTADSSDCEDTYKSLYSRMDTLGHLLPASGCGAGAQFQELDPLLSVPERAWHESKASLSMQDGMEQSSVAAISA